jgi:hypothetical protein
MKIFNLLIALCIELIIQFVLYQMITVSIERYGGVFDTADTSYLIGGIVVFRIGSYLLGFLQRHEIRKL